MPGQEAHEPRRHLPRETPHERQLTRGELDEERWFEEQGEDMEDRVHHLEDEIDEADRAAPRHAGPEDPGADG
jgi:hypothetical protein